MLKIANHCLHIITFGMVSIFGNYSDLDMMVVAESLLMSWAVTHVALSSSLRRRCPERGSLAISVILLYWVGFLSKFALGMLFADQYWVVPKIVSEKQLLSDFPNAFALSTIGFVATMIPILTFPFSVKGIRWDISRFRVRVSTLSIALPLALVLKYMLKERFKLDVPGEEPLNMGIPYLSGMMSLVVGTGFIVFTNILLFVGLVLGRPLLMLFGLGIAFANAFIDLRFGLKSTVMFELVISISYLTIAKHARACPAADFRFTAKLAKAVLAFLGIVVIVAYKFMNFFRYAFLAGKINIGAALKVAVSSEIAVSRSSVLEIYNRVTGLETLAAILHLSDKIAGSGNILEMIDGSVVSRFTAYALGTGNAMVKFAVTEFGYFYISGGLIGLMLGSAFVSFGFCMLQYTMLRLDVNRAMKLACLPVLWILFIKSLEGGGNLILWAKELAVFAITFYFAARFACPTGSVRQDAANPRFSTSPL